MLRPIFVAVFGLLFLAACSPDTVFTSGLPDAVTTTASAVVKLTDGKGHGSGVHIGGAYVLTAAHVVGKNDKMKLKGSDGKMQDAEVLWANKAYDVALLKASKPELLGVSELSCRTAERGENVIAEGNPAADEFLSSYGRIAGKVREFGPWRSVLPVSMTVVPGMSGGPVFDSNGDVIGISVGVMLSRVGYSSQMVGFAYVVPGASICHLLARDV